MSLKSFHIKLISAVTIIVMLWNVIGWMGLKEILEHTHLDTENSYCAMAYCSCLVEKGISICTCHHKKETNKTASFGLEEDQSITSKSCFYDSPHKDKASLSIAIILHDYNGYLVLAKNLSRIVTKKDYYLSDIHLNKLLLAKTLLRPPIS